MRGDEWCGKDDHNSTASRDLSFGLYSSTAEQGGRHPTKGDGNTKDVFQQTRLVNCAGIDIHAKGWWGGFPTTWNMLTAFLGIHDQHVAMSTAGVRQKNKVQAYEIKKICTIAAQVLSPTKQTRFAKMLRGIVCATVIVMSIGIWVFNVYANTLVTPNGPIQGNYSVLAASLGLNALSAALLCLGAAFVCTGLFDKVRPTPQEEPPARAAAAAAAAAPFQGEAPPARAEVPDKQALQGEASPGEAPTAEASPGESSPGGTLQDVPGEVCPGETSLPGEAFPNQMPAAEP